MKRGANGSDRLLSRLFQELPDKKVYGDYYQVIEKPIALDNIQVKLSSEGRLTLGEVEEGGLF